MTALRYRSNVCVSDLGVGECTIHRAGDSNGKRWWLLWFRVHRDSDGVEDDFAVPINPNGSFVEDGPGGKTWGLTRDPGVDACTWHVLPSINVLDTRAAHDGEHPLPSLWHQTPDIVGTTEDAWTREAP